MSSFKKTNEAWFGDSFNRDLINCCYTSSANSYSPIQGELSYCSAAADKAVQIIDGACSFSDNTVQAMDFTITGSVDSLKSEIKNIKARLDDLEQSYRRTDRMRSTLKTLNYIREVE